MKVKATRTAWPINCWTKKIIQFTPVAWPVEIVGEGKSQMIGYRPFSAKMIPFRWGNLEKKLQFEDRNRRGKICWFIAKLREVPWLTRRIFSSGETLARDRRQFSQAPGKSPVKRIEQNLSTEDNRKVHLARFRGCQSSVKERSLKIKPCQR